MKKQAYSYSTDPEIRQSAMTIAAERGTNLSQEIHYFLVALTTTGVTYVPESELKRKPAAAGQNFSTNQAPAKPEVPDLVAGQSSSTEPPISGKVKSEEGEAGVFEQGQLPTAGDEIGDDPETDEAEELGNVTATEFEETEDNAPREQSINGELEERQEAEGAFQEVELPEIDLESGKEPNAGEYGEKGSVLSEEKETSDAIESIARPAQTTRGNSPEIVKKGAKKAGKPASKKSSPNKGGATRLNASKGGAKVKRRN